MNTQKYSGDSVITYLAAIAPALLQLIAVLSVGLVNVLQLDKFVLAPDFINIANFLVILISVSIISLASFWDYNKFSLIKPGENVFNQTKGFWLTLKIFFVVSVVGFLTFTSLILNKASIKENFGLWSLVQWAAYIISMVSVSFIIYALALLKIQEKRNKNLDENYIPRLIDSLRRYGHVKEPDIVIMSINRAESQPQAIVKLSGNSKYRVYTDFTGEMVAIESLKD